MSGESLDKQVDFALDRRVDSRRFKIKDKELIETVEEVFDSITLESLYRVLRAVGIRRFYGVVSSGKEARIYRAVDREGNELAVKIYLTFTSEFKKGIWKYIIGDPRFENARVTSTKSLMYLWARKEFKNLQKMYKAGVRVPKPVFVYNNIVVMEFIGQKGQRAPLLKEVNLEPDDAVHILHKIVLYMQTIYCKAKLVHADLSEFNIMLPNLREPVIIDVAQAVSIEHPNSRMFLEKDIVNIRRYFVKEVGLKVRSEEYLFKVVTSCGKLPSPADILETGSS